MGSAADQSKKQKKVKGDMKKVKGDMKKKKQSKGSNSHGTAGPGGSEMVSDPRFASVHTDPRFQTMPKHKSKVTIDSRFSRILTDKDFTGSSAPIDKRGRRKKQDSKSALLRYYKFDETEHKKKKEKEKEKETDSEEGEDDEEEEIEKEGLRKPARVSAGSESSSEAEFSDSDGDELAEVEDDTTADEEDAAGLVFEDEVPEVEVENIPVVEDGTRRLAAVNMDWRHVRAVDLLVVLQSFLPKGGIISSVAVYPSEFGLQRMKEEVHGPVGLFDDEEENEDDNSDAEIDEEKLRAYEKSRLGYYFAVVECDSIATAEYLYNVCDGVEFERSSNVLDLRFIPDSMEFKHPPRDIATEAPGNYDGIDFHTKALQHSNLPISWDEDDPLRVRTLTKKFSKEQLADMEINGYLATDDSESDGSENEDDPATKNCKRDKYKALIQSGDGSDGEEEEEDEAQEMEVTFNTDLENLSKRILEKKDKKSETVWEKHLRELKEKKAARKQKSKSKYSSDEGSSSDDDDYVDVKNEDDFFVEDEPSEDEGGKKGDRGNKRKKGKSQMRNENNDSEATTAELELLLADDQRPDDGPKGYNMKPKKAKDKKGKRFPDESKIPTVDYNDPRFSALFNSPLFALDPTDPQFKRSAAYARQMAKKQHKGDPEQSLREQQSEMEPKPADIETTIEQPISSDLTQQKSKHELSSLVRSIKMKSKQLDQPSHGKASKKEQKPNKLKRSKVSEAGDLSTLIQSVKKAKAR